MNNQPTQEIPLLYTPDNRSAVRAGIKTETRRLMKPQPDPTAVRLEMSNTSAWWPVSNSGNVGIFDPSRHKSPYGCPQQNPVRYWVREPVQVVGLYEGVITSPLPWVELIYRDDGVDSTIQATEISAEDAKTLLARKNYKRPTTSLHMLKVFTRTWLKGISVHPEQLGVISPEDAIAEGIELDPDVVIDISDVDERLTWAYSQVWRDYLNGGYDLDPVQSYASLWISIHGEESWDPRQWVWVIRFEIQS